MRNSYSANAFDKQFEEIFPRKKNLKVEWPPLWFAILLLFAYANIISLKCRILLSSHFRCFLLYRLCTVRNICFWSTVNFEREKKLFTWNRCTANDLSKENTEKKLWYRKCIFIAMKENPLRKFNSACFSMNYIHNKQLKVYLPAVYVLYMVYVCVNRMFCCWKLCKGRKTVLKTEHVYDVQHRQRLFDTMEAAGFFRVKVKKY